MMAEDDDKDVHMNPDAVEDLLESYWKEDDEEGDKLFGEEEEDAA